MLLYILTECFENFLYVIVERFKELTLTLTTVVSVTSRNNILPSIKNQSHKQEEEDKEEEKEEEEQQEQQKQQEKTKTITKTRTRTRIIIRRKKYIKRKEEKLQ